ncbi:hypothetical protein MGU_05684 [Metarhizium guizhouense ARSEF 977]|uniref:Uncharacterized protein n=1 Tax=Metarhizium guizhouense (strain ARSEF 977) TaxID=1276136 RepID=A0A0B4I3P8_METGA|nr:hypothetical protein MGU_05684 [Metarhizium guizhouense ARSEF 977]
MAPASTLLLLPASLIAFVSQALAENRPFPIAIKKQSPGSGEKILREHLAFAPLLQVESGVASSFDALSDEPHQNIDGTSRFYPPFAMSHVAPMAQHAAEELDRVRPARQVVQRLWAAVAAFQDIFAKVWAAFQAHRRLLSNRPNHKKPPHRRKQQWLEGVRPHSS